MKTQCRFTRTLSAAFAIAAISTGALAAPPAECGLIGTWDGHAGNDMFWSGVHTAGSTNTKGEMLMDWVFVNPNLFGPGATRLTGGRGVWEQTGKGQYKYTWYAYGLDSPDGTTYAIRVSGLAANADCNSVDIGYTYEIFNLTSWPPDFSGTPLYSTTGSAAETRVPLTVTTP